MFREEVIQRSGMQVARNSSEMENHVFMKAKTREEYMNMVAKLILHVREMCMYYRQFTFYQIKVLRIMIFWGMPKKRVMIWTTSIVTGRREGAFVCLRKTQNVVWID